MHYLVAVILDEPTEEKLDAAMEPFEGEEWDWFRPGGRWDGFLGGDDEMERRSRDNGFNFSPENQQIAKNCCRASEWPDKSAYAFVVDGKWTARENWDENAPPPEWAPNTPGDIVVDPDYGTKVRAALAAHPDAWVVVVDGHH